VPRRKRRGRNPRIKDFEAEVGQCVGELHRIMPSLLADYSAAALAAALTIHAPRALASCVRQGEITHEQARELIERMADLKLPRDLERF
jgi:hypothetical protein